MGAFNPATFMAIMQIAGTGMQIMGSLREGKIAEKVGEQRAAADRMRGGWAMENAERQAEILGEKRNKMIEANKNVAAAGNISLMSPTLDAVEQEIRRTTGMDISSILNQGRQTKTEYMQSAAYEEMIGKERKKQSIWDAVGIGIQGAGSIANLGYSAGWWGKKPLYGNQTAIKEYGGISKVAEDAYNMWM